MFDRDVEPELNAGCNEVDGKEKQHTRRNNGKDDKRHYQTCSKFGAHDLATAVIKQFHQIAENQKYQQDQKQQVDIDQDKHQDRVGNGNIGAKTNGPGFNKRQQSHHKEDDNDKNPFAPSTSAVGVSNRFFFPFEDSADHRIKGEIVATFSK